MPLPEITICVALDEHTLTQFRGVWPTWRHFKPELLELPWVVICDTAERALLSWWEGQLDFLPSSRRLLARWTVCPEWPQRERMLTAFVHIPPKFVKTPYWAKLDTDVVATGAEPWPWAEWFEGNPAIIGPPWGYTRPKPPGADWPAILDAWGDGIPALADGPRLNLPLMKPD